MLYPVLSLAIATLHLLGIDGGLRLRLRCHPALMGLPFSRRDELLNHANLVSHVGWHCDGYSVGADADVDLQGTQDVSRWICQCYEITASGVGDLLVLLLGTLHRRVAIWK